LAEAPNGVGALDATGGYAPDAPDDFTAFFVPAFAEDLPEAPNGVGALDATGGYAPDAPDTLTPFSVPAFAEDLTEAPKGFGALEARGGYAPDAPTIFSAPNIAELLAESPNPDGAFNATGGLASDDDDTTAFSFPPNIPVETSAVPPPNLVEAADETPGDGTVPLLWDGNPKVLPPKPKPKPPPGLEEVARGAVNGLTLAANKAPEPARPVF